MKKWIVTYTSDAETFKTSDVEGTSYTDAFVNSMMKHPGATITNIIEKKEN